MLNEILDGLFDDLLEKVFCDFYLVRRRDKPDYYLSSLEIRKDDLLVNWSTDTRDSIILTPQNKELFYSFACAFQEDLVANMVFVSAADVIRELEDSAE